jgi:hypothetical protein
LVLDSRKTKENKTMWQTWMIDEVFLASPMSTICTCPGFLPGKARRELVELGQRAQIPREEEKN